jgi:hypothetical protein
MAEAARLILMFVVFPLWVASGFADWLCHRRSAIERTSGLKENLMHLLMSTEVGLGMLAVALLHINAAVLLIVLLVFVAHELTVYWDLHYTTPLRMPGGGTASGRAAERRTTVGRNLALLARPGYRRTKLLLRFKVDCPATNNWSSPF